MRSAESCPAACGQHSPDPGADEVGQFLGRLLARFGVASELREPVRQVWVVNVSKVVAGGRELAPIGVADVAQRVKAVGDQDGGREVRVRGRIQRRDVRSISSICTGYFASGASW
jgi:hypothetical protein